jgi:transcriptional antiterminator RfaH
MAVYLAIIKPHTMSTFLSGWHLVYTKPHHEKKVQSRLTTLKINSFLPLTKILRTWHDRRKYVEVPLFPSYLFVQLEDARGYYVGMESEGFLYYVKMGKEVARVRESVIYNLRLITQQDLDLEVSSQRFQPGEHVVIKQAPLTGLNCEVVQYNSKQRLLVKIELLNRSVLITLPESYLMNN